MHPLQPHFLALKPRTCREKKMDFASTGSKKVYITRGFSFTMAACKIGAVLNEGLRDVETFPVRKLSHDHIYAGIILDLVQLQF